MCFIISSENVYEQGGAMGVAEGEKPLKVSKKKEKLENVGYLQALMLLRLAFLSSLKRKYMLWKGFYHDFRT